jgi:hypothetical protein
MALPPYSAWPHRGDSHGRNRKDGRGSLKHIGVAAAGALVGLAILLSAVEAVAQPESNNCRLPSGPCKAASFTTSGSGASTSGSFVATATSAHQLKFTGAAATDIQWVSGQTFCLQDSVNAFSICYDAIGNLNATTLATGNGLQVLGPSVNNLAFGIPNGTYFCLNGTTCSTTMKSNGTTFSIGARSGENLNLTTSGGGTVQVNGSAIGGTADSFITINDSITAVGTTGDIWVAGPTIKPATIQDVNYVVPIVGGGTGSLVSKLTSAASGGGTVFVTCTIACNAAAAATGACTINTAAVPASTTLHYAITTACTTADVTNQVAVHYSQP